MTTRTIADYFNDKQAVLGVMTAAPYPINSEQRLVLIQDLARTINQSGFGYIFLDFIWKNPNLNPAVPELDDTGILAIADEETEAKLFKLLLESCQVYKQPAFVFKKAHTQELLWVDKQGNSKMVANRFEVGTFETLYKDLRGSMENDVLEFKALRHGLNWISRLAKYVRENNEK